MEALLFIAHPKIVIGILCQGTLRLMTRGASKSYLGYSYRLLHRCNHRALGKAAKSAWKSGISEQNARIH